MGHTATLEKTNASMTKEQLREMNRRRHRAEIKRLKRRSPNKR